MKKIKTIIKKICGFIRAHRNGINLVGRAYIGGCCNIKNGKKITICNDVEIRKFVDIFAGSDGIFIDKGCDIGTRSRIGGNVIFEENVLTGPDIFVCSYDHTYLDIRLPIKEQSEYNPHINGHNEIRIGAGSWIGIHSVIIGDVHIGKHCVIGANSVVTKDIPDYCVAVGSPAKVIKKYNFDTKRWEGIKHENTNACKLED